MQPTTCFVLHVETERGGGGKIVYNSAYVNNGTFRPVVDCCFGLGALAKCQLAYLIEYTDIGNQSRDTLNYGNCGEGGQPRTHSVFWDCLCLWVRELVECMLWNK